MKLPNGANAVVSDEKLRLYCLNFDHPRGRIKAEGFLRCLGITVSEVAVLRAMLLEAALSADAPLGKANPYGTVYVIDFPALNRGRTATVRSVWMIERGDDRPRLLTCFVMDPPGA